MDNNDETEFTLIWQFEASRLPQLSFAFPYL